MIGVVANVGLSIVKGIAGVFWNSSALIADAAHSLSDLFSDFVTYMTIKISRTVYFFNFIIIIFYFILFILFIQFEK